MRLAESVYPAGMPKGLHPWHMTAVGRSARVSSFGSAVCHRQHSSSQLGLDISGQDTSQLAQSCQAAEVNRFPNGSAIHRTSWQARTKTFRSNTLPVACVERSSMQLTAIRLLQSTATARVVRSYMVS